MIRLKEFPEITFDSQAAAFKHLKENENKLIALKKAEIHKSHLKGSLSGFVTKASDEVKAVLNMKSGYVYPVINTTKYMDSHSDVHFDGIWNNTIKQNKGSIYYVADHELKINHVIAYPEDVKVYVKTLPWALLGKDYEGETEALIYEIEESKIVNEAALKVIRAKRKMQNSVRMQYVKIKLAINSEAQEDANYKAYFDEKINLIANKAVALEQGYFWGIEEAKIVKEGSMVLFGSNDVTPIMTPDDDTEDKSTENHPPSNGEQPHINFDIGAAIKQVKFKL